MNYDRKKFFDSIRVTLVNGGLSQGQVDGFNNLLNEGESRGINTEWIAYVLATAWHETAFTMQPIIEMGGTAYLKAKKYYPFYGRGYVQLTWDYNYIKMGTWLGVDLKGNPDKALDPVIAAKIIYEGMIRGMFTAKKLSDYLDGVDETDEKDYAEFLKARAIVNGSDKADAIAKLALTIEKSLRAAETVAPATPVTPATDPNTAPIEPVPVPPAPQKEITKPMFSSTVILGTIGTFLTALVGILANLNPIVQGITIIILAMLAFYVIHQRLVPDQTNIVGVFKRKK